MSITAAGPTWMGTRPNPLTPEAFAATGLSPPAAGRGSAATVPLTVVIPAPKTATKIVALRQGETKPQPASLCGDRILVEAVPSVQPVTVTWSE